MSLEEKVAELNASHFLKEFTFSQNTFRPIPGTEVELADNVIWLDDIFIVFQLKQRVVSGGTTVEAEEKWFEKKVLGTGTRQIRDTLRYLKENKSIDLSNHRGLKMALDTEKMPRPHGLVVYEAHELLPDSVKMKKFHLSDTAGVIHLLPTENYKGMVETLVTPSEISEYLEFRDRLIKRWGDRVDVVPEQAIVGQYLHDEIEVMPSIKFAYDLQRFDSETASWDVSRILHLFPERRTFGDGNSEYYSIIREVAKLNRGELREFKTRVIRSMEMVGEKRDVLPYRIVVPRTGCGFVFVPIVQDFPLERRVVGLKNFTLLHQYDQRIEKCIGITISHDSGRWFNFEWCYLQSEWKYDATVEDALKYRNPFRNVQSRPVQRYKRR